MILYQYLDIRKNRLDSVYVTLKYCSKITDFIELLHFKSNENYITDEDIIVVKYPSPSLVA